MRKIFIVSAVCLLLSACASTPKPRPETKTPAASTGSASQPPPVATPEVRKDHIVCVPSRDHDLSDYRGGGLYAPSIADSAPPTPVDVSGVPEPQPRDEPRSRSGNKSPYSVLGKSYAVLPTAAGYQERGVASWYGYKFHGRTTSNMEIYDMCAFSAAHKTLPLPSYVRVTNLDNGRSVVVRVNDRGPFHSGRVIDLSYAAAARLDMTRRGTANVEVVAISNESVASTPAPQPAVTIVESMPPPPMIPVAVTTSTDEAKDRWIQLASFNDKNNAERLLERVRAANVVDVKIDAVDINGLTRYRVRVGPFSVSEEQQAREQLQQSGIAVPR